MKEQYWKYSLIIMIVGLGILLFRQAQPFMNGILGAFTLYLLLRGFSNWLKRKSSLWPLYGLSQLEQPCSS